MRNLISIIISSSVLSTIVTGFITYIFHKRTEKFNAAIKRHYEILAQVQDSTFTWKKQTMELLGQIYIHLNRTGEAFRHTYSQLAEYDKHFEDEVIYESNKKIRDIIINNGHLIPPELLEDASKLLEHFDAWLTKYYTVRKINSDATTIQIYVGTNTGRDKIPFPENAELKFKEAYKRLFEEVISLTMA